MDEMDRQAAEAAPIAETDAGASQAPASEESPGGGAAADRFRAFIRQDLGQFQAQFPEVDIRDLEHDRAFRRFCGSRYAKEPLAHLYRDYLALAGSAVETARVREQSRASRATGAGSRGAGRGLSAGEQQALDEWNRAYPRMRMTAKEFLNR